MEEYENFIHDKYGYCYYYISPSKPPLIFNLYVEPQYRGRGHAKRLLRYVINEIKKTGHIENIEIEVIQNDSSIDTEKLTSFYEREGLLVISKHSYEF